MSEEDVFVKASVWRALSLRGDRAVDVALTQPTEAATLIVAAALGALAGVAGATISGTALGAPIRAALLIGAIAIGAALGVLGLFLQGWLVESATGALKGRGSLKAARAAIAWGSTPWMIALAAVTLVGLAPSAALAFAVDILAIACGGWAVARSTQMLAHTHGFALWRAFISLVSGGILAATATALALIPAAAVLPSFYTVPSRSMEPGLLVGDTFLASKSAYGWSRYALPGAPNFFQGRLLGHAPKRGDVIVFVSPKDGRVWVKRVIGLPGDTVELRSGSLVVNGEPVARRELRPTFQTEDLNAKPVSTPLYEETLPGGATYRTILVDDGKSLLSNTGVYKTPPESVFVLGDNRDNSVDSRLPPSYGGVGFVPYENILGKAMAIVGSARPDRPIAAIR